MKPQKMWQMSGIIVGRSVRTLPRRVKFMIDAIRHRNQLTPLLNSAGFVVQSVEDNPAYLGMFKAPYIHAQWDAETRINRLIQHLAILPELNLPIRSNQGMVIANLRDIGPEYSVVIDRPFWFHREGVLAINLFRDNLRLFTLSFAFERTQDGLVCLIGGIQGRNIPNALDQYRIFTKQAHGLRPRDLLIDLLREFVLAKGATKILCIADEYRHTRSLFFGADTMRPLPLNYDEIWLDRGGKEAEDGFFDLPLQTNERPLEEIAAKKRSMYRQRYAMMHDLRKIVRDSAASGPIVVRRGAD